MANSTPTIISTATTMRPPPWPPPHPHHYRHHTHTTTTSTITSTATSFEIQPALCRVDTEPRSSNSQDPRQTDRIVKVHSNLSKAANAKLGAGDDQRNPYWATGYLASTDLGESYVLKSTLILADVLEHGVWQRISWSYLRVCAHLRVCWDPSKLQWEAQSAYDYPTGDRALVVAGTSGKPSKKSWVKVATLLAVKS